MRRMVRVTFTILLTADGERTDRPRHGDKTKQAASHSGDEHGWMTVQDSRPAGPAKPDRHADHGETKHQPDKRQNRSTERSWLPHSAECMAYLYVLALDVLGLTRDIGNRCPEGTHKIINIDECTVTVPTSAECGAMSYQSPINDHP